MPSTENKAAEAREAAVEKILEAIRALEESGTDPEEMDDVPYRLDRIVKDLQRIHN